MVLPTQNLTLPLFLLSKKQTKRNKTKDKTKNKAKQ
jgi:hypothetical protein